MSAILDRVKLRPSWKSWIGGEFAQEYMQNLRQFLIREKQAGKIIYPEGKKIFNDNIDIKKIIQLFLLRK